MATGVSIMEFAGAWSDISDKEIETIKNPSLRSLILDENLDRYLNDPDLARQGAN